MCFNISASKALAGTMPLISPIKNSSREIYEFGMIEFNLLLPIYYPNEE